MPKSVRKEGVRRRAGRVPPSDPSAPRLSPERAFVVQLEVRRPSNVRTLRGRVEHLVTGDACRFGSTEELIGFMRRPRGS
jgi:hypothetical protein